MEILLSPGEKLKELRQQREFFFAAEIFLSVAIVNRELEQNEVKVIS